MKRTKLFKKGSDLSDDLHDFISKSLNDLGLAETVPNPNESPHHHTDKEKDIVKRDFRITIQPIYQ